MKIGKVSENVLKRSILRTIKTKRREVLNGADVGADCAFFTSFSGEFPVICMQEAPVTADAERGNGDSGGDFMGAMSMAHLIQKCANNLAAGGALPVAVMITLLLPERAEEPFVRKLMEEAELACGSLEMEIAGGQTRVCREVKVPYAVVTGFGKSRTGGLRGCAPGQDIVVSKWVGLEGTAFLARYYHDELLQRYPGYFVEEAARFDRFYSILPEAATAVKSGVCAMHDASEGGIFGALWELAEGAGVGLTIDLRKLPLRQETVEICEYCGLNPYELLSGGCLVMACEDGRRLAEALEGEGIPAAIVGKTTDSNDRIIRNAEEIRFMNRPQGDEIYKIAVPEIAGAERSGK